MILTAGRNFKNACTDVIHKPRSQTHTRCGMHVRTCRSPDFTKWNLNSLRPCVVLTAEPATCKVCRPELKD